MIEGIQWVPVVTLVGVIIYQCWLIWHIQKVHEKTQKDLLDRIMTRNYETFVQGEMVREQAKQPAPSVYEEERGIPI